MSDIFYMESRGSMTQFNPITPEQVEKLSEGNLTFAELSEVLNQYGLSIDYVIHDASRYILNTCYADYERGLYRSLRVTRTFLEGNGRGTHLVTAEVAIDDIVAFFPSFSNENEVLVRSNTVCNIRYEDMFPANQETFTKLTVPAIPEFLKFGRQAKNFGYREESIFEFHGLKHILRVLPLSLVYFYNSGAKLNVRDKGIMIYFSLLHDVGQTNEERDDEHGAASVTMIKAKNFCIDGLELNKKDRRIADLIIRYHCRNDEEGLHAINTYSGFSGKDKRRAALLYRICKDMDGLDRVRFNGLDYRMLRTKFARQLPIIAGCLLKENVLAMFPEDT